MSTYYDLIVIGAGSGGLATARRAASYGARVLLLENSRLGGTCVNLGCVPKKIMWAASSVREIAQIASHYGTPVTPATKRFEWEEVKGKRDEYVARLNGIYEDNLKRDKVDLIKGTAKLGKSSEIIVDGDKRFTSKSILIATGSSPNLPKDVPGANYGITSDDFFKLEKQPSSVAIVGSGYIAAELAGIFSALGTKVAVWCRQGRMLTRFDEDIALRLQEEMEGNGVVIHKETCVKGIAKDPQSSLLTVKYTDCSKGGTEMESGGFDCLLWAIGRSASDTIGAQAFGLKLDKLGNYVVNEWQECDVKGYYAVGDCTGNHMLTPVAIAAGRLLADRLFGGKEDAKLDYKDIPSVVFSHPPIGTIGMSESEARIRFDKEEVRVYRREFANMFHMLLPASERPSRTLYKVVTVGRDERIVGVHMIGMSSDEILQGFAVAIKMGARKADFTSTIGLHPTSAEELLSLKN